MNLFAIDLIQRLQEAHAKLGNHPNVVIRFSEHVEGVTPIVSTTRFPAIVIPVPAIVIPAPAPAHE
jgi:hypothetical protein